MLPQFTSPLYLIDISVIISLRIYALYACPRWIKWGLLIYACALAIVVAWFMSHQSVVEASTGHAGDACHVWLDRPFANRMAVSWEVLLAYDLTIFMLTIYKSWTTRHSFWRPESATLMGVLIRDGAVYFMLMALANLANILTLYFAPPRLRGRLSTFASCLTITIVSRMMLNLHRVDIKHGIMSTLTELRFNNGPAEADTIEFQSSPTHEDSPSAGNALNSTSQALKSIPSKPDDMPNSSSGIALTNAPILSGSHI
ncbi:hypothetical protein DL96DRAFT_1706468 [Flagelloscypha sp. PMI_526]|nr:hypothetical protein DL96DRAFT_1706468 [Flagelloscypha sp. PMI_526]